MLWVCIEFNEFWHAAPFGGGGACSGLLTVNCLAGHPNKNTSHCKYDKLMQCMERIRISPRFSKMIPVRMVCVGNHGEGKRGGILIGQGTAARAGRTWLHTAENEVLVGTEAKSRFESIACGSSPRMPSSLRPSPSRVEGWGTIGEAERHCTPAS